jgi:HrpA-like RNA helicase
MYIDDIKEAMTDLMNLKALENVITPTRLLQDCTRISELGRVLSAIPLLPKYSKLLLQCRMEGVLCYGLLLVCVLSAEEIIKYDNFKVHVNPEQKEKTLPTDDLSRFKRQVEEVEHEADQLKAAIVA